MRFDVITLFPEMFAAVTASGITRRALDEGRWSLATWNPRDFTSDRYRTVDDRPYGGGPGMVMLAEPLSQAIDAAIAASTGGSLQASTEAVLQASADAAANAATRGPVDAAPPRPRVILLSPQGAPLTHRRVMAMAATGGAVLVCGRYEAVDERLVERLVDEEISLGDFVLSGGEIAAMALIDAVVRQLPGVLGAAASAPEDSFADEASGGLLDCPHYTRPECWRDRTVPEPLLSGHHARIVAWRRERSLEATLVKRPDLIAKARAAGRLSKRDEQVLAGFERRAIDGVADRGLDP